MSSLFTLILILGILNSILFYGQSLGISVTLFIIPILLTIYYAMTEYKKNINKKGFLLMIPILILSLNYFIYNNDFLKTLNIIIIQLLLIFTFILTTNQNLSIKNLISDTFTLFFKPLECTYKVINLVKLKFNKKLHLSDNAKRTLKSLILILPIVIVVIALLSSADLIFNNIFENIIIFIEKVILNIKFAELVKRIILIIIFFLYFASVLNYVIFNYDNKEMTKTNSVKDTYTIKVLFTALNIIYLIFSFIQIKSLFLHSVDSSINYSEYAREGFFQLMFVSIINIVLILVSKKFKSNDEKDNYINTMSILMIIFTFIIILSSFFRMQMYSQEFGYTLLRILVYTTLFTETILLIPTIIYVYNSKIKIINYYLGIIVFAYSLLNLIDINSIIARKNIDLYYKTNKIDLYYLKNDSSDNVDELIEFYNKNSDEYIKNNIKNYIDSLNFDIESFQSFNISKYKANKIIKEYKNNEG